MLSKYAKTRAGALAGLLAVLILTGCVTRPAGDVVPPTVSVDRLVPLAQIVTPENAKRALVIAQDIRTSARDALADYVRQDGVLTTREQEMLTRFDGYDSRFREAWRIAKNATDVWEQNGGPRPASFDGGYAEVVDLLLKPNGLRDVMEIEEPVR
jgi:hypothetical protein